MLGKLIDKVGSLSFKMVYTIIALFCALLYSNTLNHEYTQDDAIVIYDNMYTQKGVKGISGLLTKDTFFGFFKTEGKSKLVSGGRYRPLTPIMFAIEYQMFGANPFIGHLMNLLWYCLLCILLFKVLNILSNQVSGINRPRLLALTATLLFASHPVHTEVIANIKGRDEIIALLGSITVLFLVLKQIHKPKLLRTISIVVCTFLACMSKENAITFLAIIPLTIVLFYDKSWKKALSLTFPVLIGAIIFLVVRTLVLGLDFGGAPMELMNNPFIKLINGEYVPFSFNEKFATISVILLKYLELLIFPLNLTHDYYPRHIDIYTLGQLKPIVGLFVNLFLLAIGLFMFKKNKIVSYSILFYFITGSIVSNIFFPVGTNMSERFLFMPSVGFCFLLAYLLLKLLKNNATIYFAIVGIILLLFTARTIDRNQVWVNDFTLFTTDVHNSPQSAKVLNAAGGASIKEASKMQDGVKKEALLNNAITHLEKAIEIHPRYKNAYLLLGNAYYYTNQYDQAITAYEGALKIDPNYPDAGKNLGITLRDAGRKAGEVEKNLSKSIKLLTQSTQFNPTDGETFRLLGVAYGIAGQHDQAIQNFKKVVDLNPNNAAALLNLSNAYLHIKDSENANKYRSEALLIDPNVLKK